MISKSIKPLHEHRHERNLCQPSTTKCRTSLAPHMPFHLAPPGGQPSATLWTIISDAPFPMNPAAQMSNLSPYRRPSPCALYPVRWLLPASIHLQGEHHLILPSVVFRLSKAVPTLKSLRSLLLLHMSHLLPPILGLMPSSQLMSISSTQVTQSSPSIRLSFHSKTKFVLSVPCETKT